ncbi:tandem-95 repeat protein, partial [Flavobacteriaceae bacterium]|nr:tandem-95 repeat protein [Flavobacteriaceae bacterium]
MKQYKTISFVVFFMATIFSTQSVFSQTAPVTTDDTLTVVEDSNLIRKDVVENDTDADNDPLILTEFSYDGDGAVDINTDNTSLNYTPAADFNGTETITYTVSDGTSTATGTLTVEVTEVNDTPVAVDDSLTVIEDADLTSKDVIENDSDVDQDTLTLTEVSYTGEGIVAVNSDGVSVDYTPAADFDGTETITYTVFDGTLSTTGILTVTVTAVNDNVPVTEDDTLTVDEDSGLTNKNVVENDTDADNDPLTLTEVLYDGDGAVAINTDNASIDYTPAENFNGTEIITYTVSDGTDTATGTLTVDVTAINDAPIAVDDTLTVIEDADLTNKNVIENDTDVDQDTLTLTEVSYTGEGIVAVNSDGVSVDYTPAADFDGTETITYTVSDGTLSTTGILTVTVTAVNDNIPVTEDDTLTVDEDSDLTNKNVVENDTDADNDPLTLTEVLYDGDGAVAINTDNASIDYTPAENFNGTEIITYTVSDGTDTATGTLTVDVTAINDAPVAVEDELTVIEDADLTSKNVIENDTDVDQDTLTLTEVSYTGDGIVAVNSNNASIDYTPAADFNGTETITYTVSDGTTSTTGTLSVTVTSVNDAPIAVNDLLTVDEDSDLTNKNVVEN